MEEESDKKGTKFQSPLPLLVRLRNLIFGKQRPDIYTQITFYLNLVITGLFLFWNVMGYVAIASRKMIWEFKGIPVETIITERGEALGFNGDIFIGKLLALHGVGVICWLVVLFGLILLYRKNRRFILFTLGGIIFYLGMEIIFLKFRFFIEDTTNFDKIAMLVSFVSLGLHAYLMSNERKGGSISFFGEVEDDA